MKVAGRPFWIVGMFKLDGFGRDLKSNEHEMFVRGEMSEDPKLHPTYESARQEAERLATQFPQKLLYIFQATTVSTAGDAETWKLATRAA